MTGPGIIPRKLENKKRADGFGPTIEYFGTRSKPRGLQIAREQLVDSGLLMTVSHRPTIVGPAGTEGNHSSAFCGRPSFFTAAVAAVRCLVLFSRYYGAEICSLEPVHMLNRCRQFFCAHNLVSTSCGHRHVTLAFRSKTLSL